MFRVEFAGVVGIEQRAPRGLAVICVHFTAHFAVSDDCSFHFIPFPAKIRISEGQKQVYLHFAEQYLGAAKNTNKRGQKQVCLHFAERRYLRRSQRYNLFKTKRSGRVYSIPEFCICRTNHSRYALFSRTHGTTEPPIAAGSGSPTAPRSSRRWNGRWIHPCCASLSR